MKNWFAGSILLGIWLLAGCTQDVSVYSQSDITIEGAYSTRVPGKWALYVDTTKLPNSEDEDETFCPSYTWNMDVGPALQATVAQNFEKLADSVVVLDHAPTANELRSGHFTGVIVIYADTLHVQISTKRELSSAMAVVAADMRARLHVFGRRGPLFDESVGGSGQGVSSAGVVCENNAAAIEPAIEASMRALVRDLGSQFLSAPELRNIPLDTD